MYYDFNFNFNTGYNKQAGKFYFSNSSNKSVSTVLENVLSYNQIILYSQSMFFYRWLTSYIRGSVFLISTVKQYNPVDSEILQEFIWHKLFPQKQGSKLGGHININGTYANPLKRYRSEELCGSLKGVAVAALLGLLANVE